MNKKVTKSIAGLLAASALLAGCVGGGPDADERASVDQSEQEILSNADGTFYVANNTRKMYMLYSGSKYCWVKDMGQHDALQGFSSNNYTAGLSDFELRNDLFPSFGRTTYTGHCVYPTGCFKKKGEAPIYKVNKATKQFCWLRNMAAVRLYCGSETGWWEITRDPSEIDFAQYNWFDTYTGYCQ
jgi:hypothetical protein